jgi:hypothetical protein
MKSPLRKTSPRKSSQTRKSPRKSPQTRKSSRKSPQTRKSSRKSPQTRKSPRKSSQTRKKSPRTSPRKTKTRRSRSYQFGKTFQTLSGEHDIDVQQEETDAEAVGRYFKVDPRRVVVKEYGDTNMAVIKPPFDLHHQYDFANKYSANYRLPDGFYELIENNIDKLNEHWGMICSNPATVEIMKKYPQKIDWNSLSSNSHPDAISILANNLDKGINWGHLTTNPGATEILNQHLDKVIWSLLSRYGKTTALLRKHIHHVDWRSLSSNPTPEAIELLAEHVDKIDFYGIVFNTNPDAFSLVTFTEKDLDSLKKNNNEEEEEEEEEEKEEDEEEDDADDDDDEDEDDDDDDDDDFDEDDEYQYVLHALALHFHPNAIHLLETKINELKRSVWENLSGNPNQAAVDLLKRNVDKIDWDALSKNTNPDAIQLFQNHMDGVDWERLSYNPAAIEILRENKDEIRWYMLAQNPNPEAVSLLRELKTDEIDWTDLSGNLNPASIKLLEENVNKIKWHQLSSSENRKEAAELLQKYINKKIANDVNWTEFSKNPYALPILRKYVDKIKWFSLLTMCWTEHVM